MYVYIDYVRNKFRAVIFLLLDCMINYYNLHASILLVLFAFCRVISIYTVMSGTKRKRSGGISEANRRPKGMAVRIP